MRDRPSPSNGKRDVLWGTLAACSECGRCLCYGCHPHGPCRDERDSPTLGAVAATNPETPLPLPVNDGRSSPAAAYTL